MRIIKTKNMKKIAFKSPAMRIIAVSGTQLMAASAGVQATGLGNTPAEGLTYSNAGGDISSAW